MARLNDKGSVFESEMLSPEKAKIETRSSRFSMIEKVGDRKI